MSVCAQCGSPLDEVTLVCKQCAPAPEVARSPQWGTLDIKRADLPPSVLRRRAELTQPMAAGKSPLPDPLRESVVDAGPPTPNEPPPDVPHPALAGARRPPVRGASSALDPATVAKARAQRPLSVPLDVARGSAPREHAGEPPHPARPPSAALDPAAVARARGQRPLSVPLDVARGSFPRDPRASEPRHPARPQSVAIDPGAVARAQRPQSARIDPGAFARAKQPSGPLGGAAAAQLGRPHGSIALDLPPVAAGQPDNANHLDTGMLEIDGRFSDAMAQGPALEMASLQPKRLEEAPARAAAAMPALSAEAPRSPPPQRARRVQDLARYGQAPPQLVGAIPYFLRVYSRRRVLEGQLSALTQQRKRLELASDDALVLLGQALYGKRNEPQLRPVTAQLRLVSETAQEASARAAVVKRSEQEHNERDQARVRVSNGGMQSAYRDALRALANAAQRAELAALLAPDEYRAAAEARERATAHRESEEMMRSAASSYDLAAYRRGQHLLTGAAIGTFLLFALLIIF